MKQLFTMFKIQREVFVVDNKTISDVVFIKRDYYIYGTSSQVVRDEICLDTKYIDALIEQLIEFKNKLK